MSNVNAARDFGHRLWRIEKRIPANLERLLGAVALEAYRGVTDMAPVKSGRYRASFTLQQGSPDTTVAPAGLEAYPDHDALVGDAAAKTERVTLDGGIVWINNSLPYAKRIEEGWSKKAAQGVVTRTAERLRLWLERNNSRIFGE